MKPRLVLLALAAASVLALLAGCGGGDDDGGSVDPASVAPPKSPLYVELAVQPEGQVKADVEGLAETIAGIDDLGGLIVSEFEKSAADDDEPFDFEKEVEPWLGEKGGVSFSSYDGEDFHGVAMAMQTTDADAAQTFIDDQALIEKEPAKDSSYEGIDFKVDTDDDEQAVGIVDDLLVLAEDEATFKSVVDASKGDSLADTDDFAEAIGGAPEDSFADVYLDVGTLIEQSGGTIDPDAENFFKSAGVDAKEATAVASLIPGSDQVEIDLRSDLGGENVPTGDASGLLGSLPADSFAAIASADFGEQLEKMIDQIDTEGFPGEIPPHEFKSTLKEAGIDVEKIAGSIGDLAVFAEGDSMSSLGGAVVLETQGSQEATNTVSNIGLLLRASHTPGVTAISGEASGFSIRSDELGPKPLVVIAEGEKISIGYGLAAAKKGLAAGSGDTLAGSPTYKEALSALGGTPITGFVDGPAALRLATALVPADGQEEFLEAKPYLDKIGYLAIGAGSSGDQVTAKLIAGLGQ